MDGTTITAIAKRLTAGGADFMEFGKGTRPEVIFRELCDNARHESGSGGYSGTIAEKHSYRVISGPLSMKAAKQLAYDKMDSNDKWGDAWAIPVVGEAKSKDTDVSFTVFGTSQQEAMKTAEELLTTKLALKGMQFRWVKKEVTVVQTSALSFGVQKHTRAKDVYYNCQPDVYSEYIAPGRDHASPKDAVEYIKTKCTEMAAKGIKPPASFKVTTRLVDPVVLNVTVSQRSSKGNKYQVAGTITAYKPSTEVIGYLFFGIASD
jgi:hypothetical protein